MTVIGGGAAGSLGLQACEEKTGLVLLFFCKFLE